MPATLAETFGDAVIGLGLMMVFRHNATLGGIGGLARYLQDRTEIHAGWTQLTFVACLLGVCLFLFPLDIVAIR